MYNLPLPARNQTYVLENNTMTVSSRRTGKQTLQP